MSVDIIVGDCRDVLRTLESESVHCVVTSPPYWGLRDYGVTGQIGLECDFGIYIEKIVGIFREMRRVLRTDGTLWLNLGDSYIGGGRGWNPTEESSTLEGGQTSQKASMIRRTKGPNIAANGSLSYRAGGTSIAINGLKTKDLAGIPWRIAFALQADAWWLRQDIIWSKPNPMPESVTDRCTKAHEYLFLLSKSERYYFDQEAILEPCSPNTNARLSQDVQNQIGSERAHAGGKTNGNMKAVGRLPGNKTHKGTTAYEEGDERHRTKEGLVKYARKLAEAGSGIKNNESMDAALAIMPASRNKRSVWTVATQPFKEAHFATFPPALIEPCILAGCPEGGTVLDPFAGAGTTGLVADRLQRSAILIELNPAYAEMARQRIIADAPLVTVGRVTISHSGAAAKL